MLDKIEKVATKWADRLIDRSRYYRFSDFEVRQLFLFACEEANRSNWISLKEQLPKENEYVLRYSPTWGIGVDRLTSTGGCNGYAVFNGDKEYHCEDATHWMPLPLEPKEDK